MPEETTEKKNYNLFLLGVGAVIISLVTTGISILIYHYSGDIYLDRSRPGFLPDEDEIAEQDDDEEFVFSEDGPVTKYDLDEYLKAFQEKLKELDALKNPYSPEPISDDALGISTKKAEPIPVSPEPSEDY